MRINYISDSGQPKQLTRIAYGLDVAKNLEMKLHDELTNKKELPLKKMTVQELFDEYIKVKKMDIKELSIVKIKNDFSLYILPTFKECFIDRITVKMIQDWKLYMTNKNLALNTKNNAFVNFKALLKYAINVDYIYKNPFDKINAFKDKSTIKREMDFYTLKDFKKFINKSRELAEEKEKLEKDLSEWSYYVFFNIAFYTGARKGEIHALKWSDINGEYLSIKRSITQKLGGLETTPKTPSSTRKIQMPGTLIAVLKEHKQRYKSLHNFSDDLRICNNIKNTTIMRRNELYSKSVGLKTIRIHDYRHSHASVMAYKNINIQEISRRLGHSNIEETWNTYCHLYPQSETKAVKIFDCVA